MALRNTIIEVRNGVASCDGVSTPISDEDAGRLGAEAYSRDLDGWWAAEQHHCCVCGRNPISEPDGIDSDFYYSGPYATEKEALADLNG